MTDALIYSLRLDKPNSNEYYRRISTLADRWLAEARKFAGDITDQYADYRKSFHLVERPFEELTFELLALGVELYEHGAQAAGYPFWAARLLDELVEKQSELPQLEQAIKTLRALVSGLGSSFTSRIKPGELEMIAITRAAGKPLPVEGDPDVGCTLYVQRLVQWLRSQGRISQANRFAEWDAFIESFEPERSQEIILRALTFAHEFDLSSAPTLDDFTEGVVENLSEVLPQTQWRYDETAAAHSRVQYHLGMLGAEILSRASRQRFLASKKKLVIAPACMRTRHLEILLETRCQAIGTSARELCQGCTPSCRIRQITQMGLKEGFQVYIFSDGERSAGLNSLGRDEGVAIINIDCALNIWASTWAAEDAGFPVQSLILDFASCSRYWNPIAPVDSEVVTDINIEKFARILRD